MINPELSVEFQKYFNSKRTGCCKPWKAHGILDTLQQFPEILQDADRFNKYLKNCLVMEGFNEADILDIQAWLAENFN